MFITRIMVKHGPHKEILSAMCRLIVTVVTFLFLKIKVTFLPVMNGVREPSYFAWFQSYFPPLKAGVGGSKQYRSGRKEMRIGY
jgi:hypothetical protein